MQIGLMSRLVVDDSITLEQVIGDITDAEARGLAFYALPHAFHVDAIIALAIAGRRTAAIELMTGVVPIQPRHPHALAQQALTAQLVCEGRFTLGIGLSHAVMMRDMLGLSYEHPAQQMREYLAVLEPLLALSKASAQGEFYQANARLRIPQARPVDVLVAALGPLMLDVAGQYAQGTFTWMTGARTLSALTVPRLAAAAKAASRPVPRVVTGLPIALVADTEIARERARSQFEFYGRLPSYRHMLDREGVVDAGDMALLGDEGALERALQSLTHAGVTDFAALPFDAEEGARARTLDWLADRATQSA